jgi:hypothetical protein
LKHYYQIEGLKRNNLGDVIQGIAAEKFLPNHSNLVDREQLNSLSEEPGFLIGNGWYQHEFDNFPPPTNVTPFYISVHIAKSDFLKLKRVREHFKSNSPIGCRDIKTKWLMRGFGIPAYYSSCLTLTFKNNNCVTKTKTEIIWVDNIDHPVPLKIELKLNELIPNGFVKISHDPLSRFSTFDTYISNNKIIVNELIERYSKAKLVLTTKIHCALPCIGMGVPVILIHPNPNDPRLSVLNQFIKIISYEEFMLLKELPKASINQKLTNKYISKLTYLTTLAVNLKQNPFSNKANLNLYIQFQFYKFISFITSFGIKTIYKIGFFKQTIERVFGKEYLVE